MFNIERLHSETNAKIEAQENKKKIIKLNETINIELENIDISIRNEKSKLESLINSNGSLPKIKDVVYEEYLALKAEIDYLIEEKTILLIKKSQLKRMLKDRPKHVSWAKNIEETLIFESSTVEACLDITTINNQPTNQKEKLELPEEEIIKSSNFSNSM